MFTNKRQRERERGKEKRYIHTPLIEWQKGRERMKYIA